MSAARQHRTLEDWLQFQQGLNPQWIDLSLERLVPIAQTLSLRAPRTRVISIAGTNGKGSTLAFIEAIALAHGLRVGSYSSPYLLAYNECVRIDAKPSANAALIEAFEQIESVRDGVALTAFEYRTLAALWQIAAAEPAITVLEVGMGGRLDAVNVIDADVAVVTSIGLDHQQWLGASLASIAREKCGIARRGRPLVCADAAAAKLLQSPARTIGATLLSPDDGLRVVRSGRGFAIEIEDECYGPFPVPTMCGEHQISNAACAVAAFVLARAAPSLDSNAVARALGAQAPGRLQSIAGHSNAWVDVAHNAHATVALARWMRAQTNVRRWHAVCAMYADKDVAGALGSMLSIVEQWYLASLPPPRGASAAHLAQALSRLSVAPQHCQQFDSVSEAWRHVRDARTAGDGVIVFGSFETARAVIMLESCST